MRMNSVLIVLCLLGALQGSLLGVAVGSVGGGFRRANRLLATNLFGASLVMVLILLSHHENALSGLRLSWFDVELVEYSLWMLAGPLTLLYIRLVSGRDELPGRGFLLHFGPAAVWLGYLLIQIWSGESGPELPPVEWMMLYQAAYTVLGLRLWLRAGALDRVSPGPPRPKLHAFGVPALLGMLLVQHGAQLVRWLAPREPAFQDVVPLAGAVSFVILTFLGLRKALLETGEARRRYEGSTLSPDRAGEIAERLEETMASEGLYLQPDLTLESLAGELGVPKTHLSQVLNETVGSSFLDYLAKHRVQRSVRFLTDPACSQLTIEAIARRSGFASRSAFYEAFRRHQGATPSAFRRAARGS